MLRSWGEVARGRKRQAGNTRVRSKVSDNPFLIIKSISQTTANDHAGGERTIDCLKLRHLGVQLSEP